MKYVVLCWDTWTSHLGPQKFDPVGRVGSGKVKICPRMAWIWLWIRPEASKLVNEPWNGPKRFPKLSVIDLSPFPDLLKHCSHYILKKYQFSYIVKIIDFWNFNFAQLSWPTEALFEQLALSYLCDLIDFACHDISSIFNYDKTLLSMKVDRNNMSQFCSIKSIQEFNIFIIQFKRIAV